MYAFMRYCDDISDGTSSVETKREMLRAWRARLDSCLSGDFSGSPILLAFHDTVRRFSVPTEYFHWIIDGAEMDLTIDGYETFQDLYKYCFNVASAVGLVCLQIFGYRQECAKKYAELCGVAFQLTNILRDLAEDAARGRMYLPQADLVRFQCGPLIPGDPPTRPWIELIKFESVRAVKLYDASAATSQFLAGSGRRMFRLMHATYRALLAKIEREPAAVLSHRLRVSRPQKAWIVLRTLMT